MTFEERNLIEWKETIKSLFPIGSPRNFEWDDNEAIIEALNKLGAIKQLNHMFFPSGGGMTLNGATYSTESDCIELLTDGCPNIVKPQKLTFHFFGDQKCEWAYFRLETGILSPSGVYKDIDDFQFEELTELIPGKYVERKYWDAGYYDSNESGEKHLPKTARVVTRFFRGAFVIFATASIYNHTSSTYDARHNKMSSQKFEEHIQAVIDHLAKTDNAEK